MFGSVRVEISSVLPPFLYCKLNGTGWPAVNACSLDEVTLVEALNIVLCLSL